MYILQNNKEETWIKKVKHEYSQGIVKIPMLIDSTIQIHKKVYISRDMIFDEGEAWDHKKLYIYGDYIDKIYSNT